MIKAYRRTSFRYDFIRENHEKEINFSFKFVSQEGKDKKKPHFKGLNLHFEFFKLNYYYTQINDVINEPSTPIYLIEPDQNFILFLFYFILLSSFIGFIIRTLYTIFIANPLSVGESKYFINNRKDQGRFNNLFYAFSHNYMNIVKVTFFMQIKLMLWTLLFIIPGIIKALEYSMIPYILAERPDISSEEAFRLSKELTDYQKTELFVLELSFFGWYFLGLLLCGIGIIFVYPYYYATMAELYFKLKEIKQIEITPDIPPIPNL